MKRILVVDHGDTRTLATIREIYPNLEVITLEEANERNIVIDNPIMNDIPIINHRDIPIFQEVYTPCKLITSLGNGGVRIQKFNSILKI